MPLSALAVLCYTLLARSIQNCSSRYRQSLLDVFLLNNHFFSCIIPADCLGIIVIIMLGSRIEEMEVIWDTLTLSIVSLRTGVPQSCFVYQHFDLAGPMPLLRVWVLTLRTRWLLSTLGQLYCFCRCFSWTLMVGITREKKRAVCENDKPEPCARAVCCTSSSSPSNTDQALFPCYRGSDRI